MERRRRPARLDVDPMTKVARRREKPRERWLLTRKTWKYMSDAGRRLIPDGAQNRPEDVPRIEAYFQDVCAKEPRFLLWRKSSYPGALPRPRRKKRARGGSVRARSPSDDAPPPARPTELFIGHTSGGRFDIAKLRRDFFAAPPTPSTSGFNSGSNSALNAAPKPAEDEENTLVDLLRKYLKVEEEEGVTKSSESVELNRALRRYLKRQADKVPTDSDADPSQRTLLDNLSRYYCRSPNRDNIVQDILTDRSLLKRLYHDLRKTKPYRGGRSGGSGGGYRPSGFPSGSNLGRGGLRTQTLGVTRFVSDGEDSMRSPPMSPPPLIEVCESVEDKFVDCGTQTLPIPEEVLLEIERAYREKQEAATAPTSPTSPPPDRKPTRRRSSVDHDDVSQSVSDTIKRYLRMARKKSVDADKADRFKRINYDKNLRNIKPRAPGEVDDDGLNKGCQTEEGWILTFRELQFASIASTPTSPPSPASPSQSHSFLSTLLGRNAPAHMAPVSAGGMQKSRSTGSVVLQSVSRKLFRTRSRSSSRATAWTPQGSCRWVDSAGRCVRLTDTSLLTLSEVERKALQQVALARLQELKLGIPIKIPEENTTVPAAAKPKRRPMLLKKKAFTTNIFDQSRKDEKDKDAHAVFGVPLTQCVESEKALRRQQLLGSRASLASLSALEKGDDNESCDSGEWGWAGLEDADAGPKVPAVVTACLAHLRRYGLHTIGLFRVSASIKRVRQLREEWERIQSSPLDQTTCPHDVATLLKEFLRDLPDPLLCRDLYYAFLQTQKIRSRRTQFEAIRLIVQLLPAAHRDTLSALLSFLAQLATHSADSQDEPPGNRMTAENLATIIAPSILHRNRPNETASADQLSERLDVINVVRQLVERQTELWTLPAETLHQAYVQLLHTQPACLDALLLRRVESAPIEHPVMGSASDSAVRRMWSREEFLHGAAATGGAQEPARSSDKTYSRTRRTREASDTSSGSLSSAMTIVTRLRSSEGSSGIASISHTRDSAADSNDSASDYNETIGGSDDDSCIIKASLHIPAASMSRARPAPPPRRRSTSGSESSAKRDSAMGSSPASVVGSSAASASASPSGASASASAASSPPASPPPVLAASAVRVTLSATGGEVRRTTRQTHADNIDIDRLMSLGKERNTSDARAVVLRQHDETSTSARRVSNRQEQILRREDHSLRREEQISRRDDKEIRREEQTVKKEGTTLYKRGELISSARPGT